MRVIDFVFFVFKQKTAYEMRISDWSSDVCSSDLIKNAVLPYVSRRAGQALARAQAQREVGSALNTADITPADAASRIRIRAAENVPASVSDLDDATRQLTGYSSRGMGPGQRAVRDHVQRRHSNMAHRTIGRAACRERWCKYV